MATRAEKMLGITRSSYHKKRAVERKKPHTRKSKKSANNTPKPRVKTTPKPKQRLEVKRDEVQAKVAPAPEIVDSQAGLKLIPYLSTTSLLSKEYSDFQLIGFGNWAFVYKARTTQGAHVAVKVQVDQNLSLLLSERNALYALRGSPCVPLIFDFFKNELLFDGEKAVGTVDALVMELLDGYETLEKKLSTMCYAKPEQIAAGMFRCLESIHSANLVHADINLTNFMEREQEVKLLDFGSSHFEPKKERPPGAEGTHEFTSARVDKGYYASFADDAEAAAFTAWRLMFCGKQLPWASITNDTERAESKSLTNMRNLGAPKEIFEIVESVRKLEVGQIPNYSKICKMLDKNSVRLPPRKFSKGTVEQEFRLNPRSEDIKLPFLSPADLAKLSNANIKTNKDIYTQFNVVWDGGTSTIKGTIAASIQAGLERMVKHLISFGVNTARAQKFAQVYVPTRMFL